MAFNQNPILTSDFKSDRYPCLNSNSLDSESSMIQFIGLPKLTSITKSLVAASKVGKFEPDNWFEETWWIKTKQQKF